MAEFASSQHEDGRCTVSAAGEVDIATVEEFLAEVRSALDAGATAVELDLSRVTFIDSSGLGALVRLRSEADDRGVRLELTQVPAKVSRILELTGLAGVFLDSESD